MNWCFLTFLVVLSISFDDSNSAQLLSAGTMNISSNSPGIESTKDSDIKTVDQFCTYYGIPKENCSCKNDPFVCAFERYLTLQDYSKAVSAVVIASMVIGLVGNSLVLIGSYRTRAEWSAHKSVVALLALTDAISSVLNFLWTHLETWTYDEWVYGVPLCKMIHTGALACSWLSSGFILIIGVERYFGIVHPLHHKSKKVTYGCLIANLAVVLLAGIPMFITTNVKDGLCHNYATQTILIPYKWVLIVVFMIAPMCLIFIFYARIINHLQLNARRSIALSENARLQREKNNRRSIRILLSVVVAFILCVLPVNIIMLYLAHFTVDGFVDKDAVDYYTYLKLNLVQNVSYPLHACVNPIIYTIVDQDFRKNIISMVCLRRRREAERPVDRSITSISTV